jgi:hypothetical protein
MTRRPLSAVHRRYAREQQAHGSECDECKKKGIAFQRRPESGSGFDTAPPIVQEAVRSALDSKGPA